MKLNVGSSAWNRFLLLAPSSGSLEAFRGQVVSSEHIHSELLADAQRLRGKVYLEDNAIAATDLSPDGRYVCELDEHSWHLIAMSSSGRMVGCSRFRQYPNSVRTGELSVNKAPIARWGEWASRFRNSIESELRRARAAGFSYVEVGGWALDREVRGTSAALNSVLATYAWSRLQGGALGISTATERNGSASILRRLGGRALECDGAIVPPYYDDTYKCMMEVLRFDSRCPNEKYAGMIDSLTDHLSTRPIVCAGRRIAKALRPARMYPAAAGFQWNHAFEATA